jgi:hypothetical protein
LKLINLKYILLVFCFGILGSCKTTKGVKKTAPVRSANDIYQAIVDHNIDFGWFSAKADARLESSMMSGSGDLRLRIKKDSLIWLVGKKLSIEGVRVNITPQEYTSVFRQANTFQREPFRYISSMAGIDIGFEDLQQLLIGNIMLPDSTCKSTLAKLGSEYILTDVIDGLDMEYHVDPFDLELSKVVIKEGRTRTISVSFRDYKKIDTNRNLAHRLSITFDNDGDVSKANLKFKDVELDTPKKTPFSVPEHYTRIY